MVHCKLVRTSLPTGLKLRVGDGDPVEDLHGYRSTVGALQYVTITRPELFFSVNKGTLQHGLHLKKSSSLDLVGFCDADWASDLDDRRSTSGHCAFLGANLISWQSNKQHTVSRSSTETEYRSLAGTRHIELDLYFVREKVIRKEVEVRHVPSVDQLADSIAIPNATEADLLM
ncbi:uncharacterized mitochondrial protein AtMg00810 [Vitis vinifera]|uniref:uncharacterized mitochondrial protein AtMg00810 n=1 Tax=Vitis vinifera TaxID=29760 RepID=UPI0028832B21|nr:uncharacterized mitochondrial protein AtMg00810 [Vitis vinifera]